MTDKIAESLGVEERAIIRPPKTKSLIPHDETEFTRQLVENRRTDYTTARDNLNNLIAEVEVVVSNAVLDIQTNPTARMYETFALLVRTFADLNKDLLNLSGAPSSSTTNNDDNSHAPVNNVVFVGTSDNLIDHIKGALH